jgi:predicted TPR repeat methyltransferase
MNNIETAKAIFFKGLACIEKQDFAGAENLFIDTLELAPRSIPALNNLALAQYEQKKISEAALTAQRVIEIDPRNIDAYLMLSTCQEKQKKYEEALATCDSIIGIDPTNAQAHCNRGYVLNKIKKYQEAIESFDRALEIQSEFVDAFLNRGNSLRNLKRYDEALLAYQKALALQPDLEDAWLGRGNVFNELKRYDEALTAYDKALVLKPDLENAWLGRGDVLCSLRRYDEAIAAYDKALAFKPDLENAWLGRGDVLCGLRRYDEAIAAYDKALAFKPNLENAWLGRGNVFFELKRYDEAFAAHDKALILKPDLAGAWLGRGRSQMGQGKLDEGRKDHEQALALGANKDAVTYDLARFGMIETLSVIPKSIVTNLFDDYADHFDEHLVQQLKYDAPVNLFNLLRRYNKTNSLDVLDLGCGTGLMGIQIISIAKTLVGVDLSQRMLDKAKRRSVYDDLICNEIIEFLKSHTKKYDLVIATDVFIYLGDLMQVFALVHRNLNHHGYFCFSVESTSEGDYLLRATGRYQHSKSYLERLALRCGFMVLAIERTILRQESTTDVPGFLAIMRHL